MPTNSKIATLPDGQLNPIENCWVIIPNYKKIMVKALPDLGDSKSASYADEPIMGRSFPLKTFSHSENRSINLQIHFYATKKSDLTENLNSLRAIQSAVYPRDENGQFLPPPVCSLKCGGLLASSPLCVVLKSYSVKFPTDVVWDEDLYVPWKFDVDTTWETVYKNSDLPGQDRIIESGR